MKKLALLGPARPKYQELVEQIRQRCRYCWSGWSFKINPVKEKILRKQIDKNDGFYIYVHDIKHPENEEKYGTGTGYVEFKLHVKKMDYDGSLNDSPDQRCTPIIDREKPHRLFALINTKPEPVTPRKKYYEFIDFDTERPVSKTFPFFGKTVRNKEFIYIIDED